MVGLTPGLFYSPYENETKNRLNLKALLEPPVFMFVAVMAVHSRQDSSLAGLLKHVVQSLVKLVQFGLVLTKDSVIGTCEGCE